MVGDGTLEARIAELERTRAGASTQVRLTLAGTVIAALISLGTAVYTQMASADLRAREQETSALSSQVLSLFEKTMEARNTDHFRFTVAVMVLGRVFREPLGSGLCEVLRGFFDSAPSECRDVALATLRPAARNTPATTAVVVSATQRTPDQIGTQTAALPDEIRRLLVTPSTEVATRISELGSDRRDTRLGAATALSAVLNGQDVRLGVQTFAALARVTDPAIFREMSINGRYNVFMVLSETAPLRDRVTREGGSVRQAYEAVVRDLTGRIAAIQAEAQTDRLFVGDQTRRQMDQVLQRAALR